MPPSDCRLACPCDGLRDNFNAGAGIGSHCWLTAFIIDLRSPIASVGGASSSRSVSVKSIAFFNNKGGVGKTTLSCNVAAHIATSLRKRVLVIDCDPQCNATQLVLSDDRCQEIYRNGGAAEFSTLLTVMRPISEGDASIAPATTPELSSQNRFGVDLLPGHPAMSVVEDRLSTAWNDLRGAQAGGFRITNWFPQLLSQIRVCPISGIMPQYDSGTQAPRPRAGDV